MSDRIQEAYTDGAYHSPANQAYCKEEETDWVLRGIQGRPSRYDLSFYGDGNLVATNAESGFRRGRPRAAIPRRPNGGP